MTTSNFMFKDHPGYNVVHESRKTQLAVFYNNSDDKQDREKQVDILETE